MFGKTILATIERVRPGRQKVDWPNSFPTYDFRPQEVSYRLLLIWGDVVDPSGSADSNNHP